MGRPDLFQFVDRALGGQLEQRLRERRAERASYDDIARELHGEGLPVTGETVRKWCKEREIAKPAAVAS